MPLLTDVGAYLVANVGSLSYGSSSGNLFLVPFPATAPQAAVCLIEYPGSGPDRALAGSAVAPVDERPRFQVTVRDQLSNYATARALAETIYAALDQLANVTLGATRYLLIRALQPPFYLGEDDDALHRIVFNCEAVKERG